MNKIVVEVLVVLAYQALDSPGSYWARRSQDKGKPGRAKKDQSPEEVFLGPPKDFLGPLETPRGL